MPSLTKLLFSAVLLAAVFAAGRLLAPNKPDVRAMSPVAPRNETESASLDAPPLLDVAAISVGERDQPAPTLASISIEFGTHEKNVWYASGFVVVDDVVLTATHALSQAFDAKKDHIFVDCKGQRVAGTLLYHDRGQEVMLIGASCGHADVEIDTAPLDWNDKLVFAGINFTFEDGDKPRQLKSAEPFARPTSYIPSVNLGNDENRFQEPARRVYLEIRQRNLPEPFAITGAMVQGNSGGPVYRKANGAIVGFGIIMDTEYDRTFVVPAVTIQAALRKAGLLK